MQNIARLSSNCSVHFLYRLEPRTSLFSTDVAYAFLLPHNNPARQTSQELVLLVWTRKSSLILSVACFADERNQGSGVPQRCVLQLKKSCHQPKLCGSCLLTMSAWVKELCTCSWVLLIITLHHKKRGSIQIS